jgi:hypothetical protein
MKKPRTKEFSSLLKKRNTVSLGPKNLKKYLGKFSSSKITTKNSSSILTKNIA